MLMRFVRKNVGLHQLLMQIRSCFEFIAQSTHENGYIKPRKTFWRNSKQLLSGNGISGVLTYTPFHDILPAVWPCVTIAPNVRLWMLRLDFFILFLMMIVCRFRKYP